MMETIKNFFARPVFEGDEDKTHRARLLHVILVAQAYVLLLTLAGTLYPVLVGKVERAPEVFVILGGLFLILVWRFLMQRGQVNAASVGMLIFFILSVTMILVMGGTIRSAGVIYYPLVVVMAILLISKRAGVIFFIITSLVAMGVIQAEIAGLLPSPANQTNIASHAILLSGMGLTLCAGWHPRSNNMSRRGRPPLKAPARKRQKRRRLCASNWMKQTLCPVSPTRCAARRTSSRFRKQC
jgi:hypothetical protein